MNSRELKVKNVKEGSPAYNFGFKPEDKILSINGRKVEDVLDFHFYSIEDNLNIAVLRGNRQFEIKTKSSVDFSSGLDFYPMEPRKCGNNCIFCFTDQNPKGLRKNLYFKDEDYRFSFLHGNFVTLTNISQRDLKRIAEQRLTPLYVSIHAVDIAVRKKLLGIKRDDRLLEKIKFLVSNNIELHGQIVLCPGINDNEVLEHTLVTLSQFFPALRSVAVVPVGLTKHRDGLYPLQSVTKEIAAEVLKQGKHIQRQFRKKLKESFVYYSDEFYLKAGKKIPKAHAYGEFWQIENGVGLVRKFIDDFNRGKGDFPDSLVKKEKILIVTGRLAFPVLQKVVIKKLKKIKRLDVDIIAVNNSLYGDSVTVSGLLCGADFISAAKNYDADAVIIPAKTLNNNGLFLDDLTINAVEERIKKKIVPVEDFSEVWSQI